MADIAAWNENARRLESMRRELAIMLQLPHDAPAGEVAKRVQEHRDELTAIEDAMAGLFEVGRDDYTLARRVAALVASNDRKFGILGSIFDAVGTRCMPDALEAIQRWKADSELLGSVCEAAACSPDELVKRVQEVSADRILARLEVATVEQALNEIGALLHVDAELAEASGADNHNDAIAWLRRLVEQRDTMLDEIADLTRAVVSLAVDRAKPSRPPASRVDDADAIARAARRRSP